MAKAHCLPAKENRRPLWAGETVDFPFLLLVLLLLTLGLLMLWSASFPQSEYDTGYTDSGRYLRKQALCAAIGIGAMIFFSRIPSGVWYRFAWPLYGAGIVLLLSVLVIGQEVNGAKRWINIAGIQFQPSEVAKFAQIVLFARLTRHFGPEAKTFRYGVLGFGMALMGSSSRTTKSFLIHLNILPVSDGIFCRFWFVRLTHRLTSGGLRALA